jgi:hypothetical protein
VEEKEARKAELVDQRQLLLQPNLRLGAMRGASVAIVERAPADHPQLFDRRIVPVGEVRVPVAELLRQVELEPLGELLAARDRVAVVRETLGHLGGRAQHGLAVPATLALAAVERGVVADRDEYVLERYAALVVGVHVARDHSSNAERAGEVAERGVSARVAAFVRALELDEEPIRPEHARELGRRIRIVDREAVPRTTREADEPLVQLGEEPGIERGRERLGSFLRPRIALRFRQEPAEVRVAARRLDEERDVPAASERHLGAGDRANAERLRCVGELERAAQPVVIGQGECLVAELCRCDGELLRPRRSVEERVRRVSVQLYVAHARGTNILRRWTASSAAPARAKLSAAPSTRSR